MCGIKDRRAVTTQRVSSSHVELSKLYGLNSRLKGIVISDAKHTSNRLSVGQLFGNRFSIALRDFRCKDDAELQVHFL